jgi:hypothetical protein
LVASSAAEGALNAADDTMVDTILKAVGQTERASLWL